jgi:hypothetical protein
MSARLLPLIILSALALDLPAAAGEITDRAVTTTTITIGVSVDRAADTPGAPDAELDHRGKNKGKGNGKGKGHSRPVPEPMTMSLLGLGGVGLAYSLRRRRTTDQAS